MQRGRGVCRCVFGKSAENALERLKSFNRTIEAPAFKVRGRWIAENPPLRPMSAGGPAINLGKFWSPQGDRVSVTVGMGVTEPRSHRAEAQSESP
jgi:hypothetical protein